MRYVEKIFFEQISKSTELASQIAYYKRLKREDQDNSLEFLERIAVEYVDEQRRSRNRAEHKQAMQDTRKVVPGPIKPCRDWKKKGSCINGANCGFSHDGPAGGGNASSGSPKGKNKGGKDKRKGGKKGDGRGRSQERSPKGKGDRKGGKGKDRSRSQSPCWDFADGKCTNPNCRFKHRSLTQEEEESRAKKARSPSPAASSKVCKDYMNGKCKKGKKCPKGKHPTTDSESGNDTSGNAKKKGGSSD